MMRKSMVLFLMVSTLIALPAFGVRYTVTPAIITESHEITLGNTQPIYSVKFSGQIEVYDTSGLVRVMVRGDDKLEYLVYEAVSMGKVAVVEEAIETGSIPGVVVTAIIFQVERAKIEHASFEYSFKQVDPPHQGPEVESQEVDVSSVPVVETPNADSVGATDSVEISDTDGIEVIDGINTTENKVPEHSPEKKYCEDNDGDGYYTWDGDPDTRPSYCPSKARGIRDCNDSNPLFAVSVEGVCSAAPSAHYIRATSSVGGHIQPSGIIWVSESGEVTFTCIPDKRYQLNALLVDGSLVTVPVSAKYTISDVVENHTIHAIFEGTE